MREVSKKFRCEYPHCEKSFNRRDYLERHAVNHMAVKPFFCRQCKRHFSRKDLYDNHMNTRFHAKRLEELAQASASGPRLSNSSQHGMENLSNFNLAPPGLDQSTQSSGPSSTSSPLNAYYSSVSELEEPLLPLAGPGNYTENFQPASNDQYFWDRTPNPSEFAAAGAHQDGSRNAMNKIQAAEFGPVSSGWPEEPIRDNLTSSVVAEDLRDPQGDLGAGFFQPQKNDFLTRSQSYLSEPVLLDDDDWKADIWDLSSAQPKTPIDSNHDASRSAKELFGVDTDLFMAGVKTGSLLYDELAA